MMYNDIYAARRAAQAADDDLHQARCDLHHAAIGRSRSETGWPSAAECLAALARAKARAVAAWEAVAQLGRI